MSDTLTAMPEAYCAGNSLTYTRTIPDYPAGTYSMTVYVVGGTTPSKMYKAATASGTDFVVAFSGGDNEGGLLAPGNYRWIHRVTKAGFVFDAEQGRLIVLPNIATATADSYKTPEEKMLAVMETKLQGTLAAGYQSYIILGRSLSMIDPREYWSIYTKLRAIVKAQRSGGRLKPIHVTFGSTGESL
jgi:hypothetical protein